MVQVPEFDARLIGGLDADTPGQIVAETPHELDTRLMLRLRDGESECLDQLLARHRPSVVYFLYRMIQNQDVAEELAQEVFLRVYRSRAQYQATAKFTTWLYRIATNLALNWLRDRRYERANQSLDAVPASGIRRQISDPTPRADHECLKRERAEEIRKAVAELPDRQRAAVLMHKYEGLDYAEIAASLGCSVTAVKAVMFRAYTTLRERLNHLAEES